jgi:hypothetical protein
MSVILTSSLKLPAGAVPAVAAGSTCATDLHYTSSPARLADLGATAFGFDRGSSAAQRPTTRARHFALGQAALQAAAVALHCATQAPDNPQLCEHEKLMVSQFITHSFGA